jgi:membrane associated rhomboid family serine protease
VIPLYDTIPTRRTAVVTGTLIAINAAVFLYELAAPSQVLQTVQGQAVIVPGFDALTAEYGFVPCELASSCPLGPNVVDLAAGVPPIRVDAAPTVLTIFTSMFMHGGWSHFLGNMLFLWVFGNNVEDRVGRGRFLAFYLLGGLAAAALQFAIDPNSQIPNIGASGAIAAVLGGYLLLHPRAGVISYIPPFFFFPVPAAFFLVIWFVLQLVSAGAQQVGASGGVAYFAHIGGFLFGLLTIKFWEQHEPPPRFGYG